MSVDFWDITVEALRACVGVGAASYALACVGLNLQVGYTGLFNFGHVASLAAGAYGVAIPIDNGVSMWVALLIGLAVSIALSTLMGLTALRLRLDYLAIATIATGECLRFFLRSKFGEPLTGGVFGIQQIGRRFFEFNPFSTDPNDRLGWGGFSFDGRTMWVMVVCWSLVIIGTWAVWMLIRSPWGRAIKAVREDEYASRSLGKNVVGLQMQSFILGGLFGALAGIILAFDRNVNPDFYLTVFTFQIFVAMLIGGPGTILGPIVGSIIFWFVFEWFDGFMVQSIRAGWFDFGTPGSDNYTALLEPVDAGPIRFVLVGLVLILLIVFMPQGILGKREEGLLSDS